MKKVCLPLIGAVLLITGCATRPKTAPLPGVDLARYNALIIDSVHIAPEASQALSAEQREALEHELHYALVDALPPTARAITPRPDALRVQVTVTALNESSPALNAISTALLILPMDRGGLSLEARFYETDGAESIGKTTWQYTSKPYEVRGSFRRWGLAVEAIRDWGSDLASGLDKG